MELSVVLVGPPQQDIRGKGETIGFGVDVKRQGSPEAAAGGHDLESRWVGPDPTSRADTKGRRVGGWGSREEDVDLQCFFIDLTEGFKDFLEDLIGDAMQRRLGQVGVVDRRLGISAFI